MGITRQLQLVLTFGALATASWIAKTSTDDDDDTPLPLVIWHGLGDTYNNPGIIDVGDIANEINPGTLVHIVNIGGSANSDRSATFLGNVNEHVDKLCADLAADPIISTAPAIDAIGFSQGGQFLRAYVERCNNPPVRSLVTFGSQHNGISEFMECGLVDVPCHAAIGLLRTNVWSETVQTRVVPAQYFRDPSTADKYEKYLEHSGFLADINNERPNQQNPRYKENIANMTNFVMYMFEDDTTAIPKESSWFSEVNGTDDIIGEL
ncbi:palmitoyl protein thioesterase [Ophiostoma piceae UAMH 11346]|uniref:Palmitoyl-protein thioesterase 1 n=1 Tax=Ophiostoma piceae (strain UAMH 11346) TaxID=1262450 RepID=S3BZ18_OPHP1|nr:palmitoyl protein thioesterase [Ophiostoma piceae UAMH 11346]